MNFKNKILIFSLIALFFSVFFGLGQVKAAETTFCFCYDDPAKIDATNYTTAETGFLSSGDFYCKEANKVPVCSPEKINRGGNKKYDVCSPAAKLQNATSCAGEFTIWQADKNAKLNAGKELEKSTTVGAGLGAFLPECINTEKGCRDAGVFVEMGINAASYLFSIIGALALLMFVYGGFTLVLSKGNPEKVKKGGEIIFTAILGLIIVFGAYVLVKFIGDALVSSEFVLK